MFGYVMTYIFGLASGIALMVVNRASIDSAVAKAKKELNMKIRELETMNKELTREYDGVRGKRDRDEGYTAGYDDGYREGMDRGRNLSGAERLESTLSNSGRRTVQIGGRNG